jgi:GNAT superfamily N-acetyltransferase
VIDIHSLAEGSRAQVAELATAALTLDSREAPSLVERLSAPPEGRRWTALVTPDHDGVVFASMCARVVAPAAEAPARAARAEGVSADAVHAEPGRAGAGHVGPDLRRVGHVDLLAVHPSAQGRGIGSALVGAAEDWLRAQGASEVRFAGNPPCYAWPGIDVRYTPAVCLAERLGYERYRTAWNMTADLSRDLSVESDLARLASAGVTVHSASPGERAEVVEFVRKQWNDSWAWETSQAAGCHYATRGGEILGFAAWGARPLWFGPMGTAEAARGLGVGRVLLRRCLAEMAATGLPSAQIGWVGPLRFYSRAIGAWADRVFWLYRRTLS